MAQAIRGVICFMHNIRCHRPNHQGAQERVKPKQNAGTMIKWGPDPWHNVRWDVLQIGIDVHRSSNGNLDTGFFSNARGNLAKIPRDPTISLWAEYLRIISYSHLLDASHISQCPATSIDDHSSFLIPGVGGSTKAPHARPIVPRQVSAVVHSPVPWNRHEAR